MNRAQVCVFKQINDVSLGSLLQGAYSGGLVAEVGLELLGDFLDLKNFLIRITLHAPHDHPHQSLERCVLDQHLCGLLVAADLLQRDGSRPEAANLLPDRLLRDTPSDRRKMFSLWLQHFGLSLEDLVDLGDLSPCGLSRGLLGSHHLQSLEIDNRVFKIISTTWNSTRISDVVVEFLLARSDRKFIFRERNSWGAWRILSQCSPYRLSFHFNCFFSLDSTQFTRFE